MNRSPEIKQKKGLFVIGFWFRIGFYLTMLKADLFLRGATGNGSISGW